MNPEIEKRITKARVQLILNHPFLGALALGLPVVPGESVGCPTMGTDGRRLYYNEKFVEKLTDEILLGVVAHEIMHCVYQHVVDWRRASLKEYPEIFTMAQEYSVNAAVRDVFKLELPSGCYYATSYSQMYTEEIYADLLKKLKPEKSSSFAQELSEKMVDTHGLGAPGASRDGDGNPCEGTWNEEPLEAFAGDMKLQVARAANAARMQGKFPAGLERILDEILDAKVPWIQVLAEYVSSIAKTDYTWKRPNRRYIYQGIVFPSIRSEQLEVALIFDTSGSISIQELTEAWSEVKGIMGAFASYALHLIGCDAKVHSFQSVGPHDEPDLKELFKGGGGTDFRLPFLKLQEENIQPRAAIYFTADACGTFPDEEPEYPVLWVVKSGAMKVPFGKTIVLE